MKKLLLLLSFCLFIAASETFASSYTIDDSKVEALFENSVQVASFDVMHSFEPSSTLSTNATLGEKEPIIAVLLAWFLGPIAIHRVYLGGTGLLVLGYCVTVGGIFGIVPFIDLIVLIIGAVNDDISKYIDNDKFFMW